MKRLLWILPVLMLALVLYLNSVEVDAATDATVVLSAGQHAKVVANGCFLSVVNATNSVVKVKCNAFNSANDESGALPAQTNAPITLTAGKSVKIKANACSLAVGKNTTALVKVSCQVTPTPTPTQASNTVKVGFGGSNFSPQQITIHAGETVHWTWSGSNHTVTSGVAPTADNAFCSPNDTNCGTANPSNAGATYDHTFNSLGTFQYFCQIHGSAMTGTVVVQP